MKEKVRHYFGGGAAALNMHERLSDVLMWAVNLHDTTTGDDAGTSPLGPAMNGYSSAQAACLPCMVLACSPSLSFCCEWAVRMAQELCHCMDAYLSIRTESCMRPSIHGMQASPAEGPRTCPHNDGASRA